MLAGTSEKVQLIMLAAFFLDESGVTAVEYGLIAGLIGVVIISSLHSIGEDLKTTFNDISSSL